jgi:RNA polymerase sigma-70 factor (ECF subfamily)
MAVSEDFARLTAPFRPELLAHCYRMLGSVHDAEDQVQETMIRAWRSYGEFEGRASVRTWLYRIATQRLPARAGEQQPPAIAVWPGRPGGVPGGFAGRGAAGGSVAAALSRRFAERRVRRSSRDRRVAEVAELLGTTTTAVNGMLQRARARFEQEAPGEDQLHEPADPVGRALLDRYATAFQNADITAVMALLRDDAVFEMPPEPTWFTGRALIGRFLQSRVLTESGLFQMIPTAANGQPTFAIYLRGHDGVYRAHGIQVLTLAASRVTRVTSFNDPGLFTAFALPEAVPAVAVPAR